MDSFQNKIQLDMASSPSLASAFAGKSAGDTVELKVTFTIDDLENDTVTGSLDEVCVCEDDQEETDEDTSVSASTPVMIVMSKKDK